MVNILNLTVIVRGKNGYIDGHLLLAFERMVHQPINFSIDEAWCQRLFCPEEVNDFTAWFGSYYSRLSNARKIFHRTVGWNATVRQL